MNIVDLICDVEIQGEYKIVYYDWEKEERVETTLEKVGYCDAKYMYVEDGIIYIEVELDTEN